MLETLQGIRLLDFNFSCPSPLIYSNSTFAFITIYIYRACQYTIWSIWDVFTPCTYSRPIYWLYMHSKLILYEYWHHDILCITLLITILTTSLFLSLSENKIIQHRHWYMTFFIIFIMFFYPYHIILYIWAIHIVIHCRLGYSHVGSPHPKTSILVWKIIATR